MSFNRQQLATEAQANVLMALFNAKPVNGKLIGDGAKSLYRPDWAPGPENFPEPNYVDPETGAISLPYYMRFKNGAGMNVGLMLDKFERYPTSPDYVMGALFQEAADNANPELAS